MRAAAAAALQRCSAAEAGFRVFALLLFDQPLTMLWTHALQALVWCNVVWVCLRVHAAVLQCSLPAWMCSVQLCSCLASDGM
jgi:hypothetical protein